MRSGKCQPVWCGYQGLGNNHPSLRLKDRDIEELIFFRERDHNDMLWKAGKEPGMKGPVGVEMGDRAVQSSLGQLAKCSHSQPNMALAGQQARSFHQ